MKAATHLAFAGLIGVVATGLGYQVGVVGGAALAAGALLPDIDTTTSGLGRWLKPVSGLVERRFGHRTLTHSFLGMLLFALFSVWMIPLSFSAWVCLLLGIGSHIVLDSHNVTGVPLLYPLRIEFVSIYNRGLRTPYGSPLEFSYLAGFSLVALALTPLSLDGFSPWFHRALGAPYGAVEDYVSWRNDFEVWAEVSGINLVTDETIDGRYLVIDALGRETLLLEDGTGKAYTAALSGADIQVRRIKVWKGERIVSSTYRLDLSGRLMSDLLASLPKGAKSIHVNAALEFAEEPDLLPTVGYFQRVTKNGTKVETRSATIGDLALLSRYVIVSGSAVVRAEYSPGTEALADLSLISSVPSVRSHLLEIPDLPGLSGLVVEVGDEVVEGQLVARYVDDRVLEISQTEIDEAKLKIPELEKQIELERAEHTLRLEALHRELESVKEKLGRIRYLVERNAEPKSSLISVENSLKEAETRVLLEESGFTSRMAQLETDLREARVSLARAEAKQEGLLEEQWVRAPVAGTISDIRLGGVSTKGVDLGVVILEESKSTSAANDLAE